MTQLIEYREELTTALHAVGWIGEPLNEPIELTPTQVERLSAYFQTPLPADEDVVLTLFGVRLAVVDEGEVP